MSLNPQPRKTQTVNDESTMEVVTLRPVQEALDELNRELQIRKRCFKRWIADGRLSRTDAQDRLDRLGSAMELLQATMTGEVKGNKAS